MTMEKKEYITPTVRVRAICADRHLLAASVDVPISDDPATEEGRSKDDFFDQGGSGLWGE